MSDPAVEAFQAWDSKTPAQEKDMYSGFFGGYEAGQVDALLYAANMFDAYGDGADAVQDEVGAPAVASMEFNWEAAERLRQMALELRLQHLPDPRLTPPIEIGDHTYSRCKRCDRQIVDERPHTCPTCIHADEVICSCNAQEPEECVRFSNESLGPIGEI